MIESPAAAHGDVYRDLVESIRDYAVFLLDTDGRVVTWNVGAQLIKGYTADEIIGRSFAVFYPEEERAQGKPARVLATARETGHYEEEGWRVRKDGSRFWANVVIRPRRAGDGTLLGFAKVTRDLTERQHAEQQRLRAEVAEAALRARDEFISVAAHELKTPITSAKVAAQILQRSFRDVPLTAGQSRSLSTIDRQIDKMSRLVGQLLDTVRIHAGSFTLQLEDADLSALVREVAEEVGAISDQHTIVVTAPAELPARVDKLRLEQVLRNLLDNAVKFMPDGGQVDVHVQRLPRAAVITVRDRGVGVAPEHLGRLFERFYQAHPNRTGLGLGLYVARQIVERHGGTIHAEMPGDVGTRFVIDLPLPPTAP